MPYQPPPELAELTLSQIAEQVASRKLPPVENWEPQKFGDSRMRIAADGKWFHDGSVIKRDAMVRAFSGLLTRDADGSHHLVSPFEKLSIQVEDAGFIATDVAERADDNGPGLAFRLNTDELIIAGPDHQLVARGSPETPALYLHVRRGVEARLNRSTYAQLAEIALAHSEDWTVTSQGQRFSLLPA
ncbi:MAG: DUF1285 domain-containing protein [Erythrobacter sp.]